MKNLSKIEKLLVELLNIKSVTGNEKKLADFIVNKLEGFEVEKQVVAGERYNIIAKKGGSKTWFVAHLDTVPGDVPIRITKDKIFGRGACDNKGNIAGAILLGNKLKNINLLFTVGEEVDFCGAKKVKIKGERFIVMEPTNFEILTGQLGIFAFLLKAKGVEKHTSQKFKQKDSAIHKLVLAIEFLLKKNFNAFNVGNITGGTVDNVVSKEAVAEILTRPKSEKECQEIKIALDEVKKKFDLEVKLKDVVDPFSSLLPIQGGVAPFFSEMSFFENSLLFGAGDIKQAHTKNEFILRKDLGQLVRKLEEIVFSKN